MLDMVEKSQASKTQDKFYFAILKTLTVLKNGSADETVFYSTFPQNKTSKKREPKFCGKRQ